MILEIKGLSFGFTPEKMLFKDISQSFEKGLIYTLKGANGVGKTTFFNLINGFLRPQKGQIIFKGKNISQLKPYQINRLGIGRIFQDLRLVSKLSVKENIILAMQNHPSRNWWQAFVPKFFHKRRIAELEQLADELINDYFLTEVKDSLAGEISFGQQKLLNLACCLANGADFLLLDEPVAGVNSAYQVKIISLLKNLKQQGKTVFLIEHNLDFIGEVTEPNLILSMNEGRLFSKSNPKLFEETILVNL